MQLKWADGEARRLGINNVDAVDANKLVLFNLPVSTLEQQLFEALDPYGEIRILKLVKDADGNRCYVKFTTKEQALLAIKELNGTYLIPGQDTPLEFVFADQLRGNRERPPRDETATVVPEIRELRRIEVPTEATRRVYYEFKSAEGMAYYFDALTNATQWDKPADANAVILSEADYYKNMAGGQQTQELTTNVVDESELIKIIIKNLPTTWEDSDFISFVNTYGAYDRARLVDKAFLEANAIEANELRAGVVEIVDATQAQNLVSSINGLDIHGSTLELEVL